MTRFLLGLAVLITVLVTWSIPAPDQAARPVAASSGDHIDRVVVVSVDGLNPEAIRRLGPAGAPTLHRLMASGASTLNARTAVELTLTLPTHTGMLTGRKVSAAAGGHGVTFNRDNGRTVHRAAGGYVASAFDVVHDRGGRTALFASKSKFAFFNRTWSRYGARDRVGVNNGRDKINHYVMRTDENQLTSAVVSRLTGSGTPAYTFVHLKGPDESGHSTGFMSGSYLQAVADADARIGRILQAIDSQARLRDHTALIVTSDHGGLGSGHGDATQAYNTTVPFFVRAPGVPAADLYALNPDFANPGAASPGYEASPPPIRNADAANLALDLLDLPVVPRSQTNTGMGLSVFP